MEKCSWLSRLGCVVFHVDGVTVTWGVDSRQTALTGFNRRVSLGPATECWQI